MRLLIQQLAERGSTGSATVFVVGAGAGVDLLPLRQLSAQRLVLAEAHPEQAEMLSRRIDPARGEEVWQLAITPAEAEHASLHVLSNPGFSSLKAPAGLLEHFPNLHEVRQASVQARSFWKAIDGLGLDAGGEHVLVLDAPGQAFELLDAIPPEALQAFRHVVVRCSVEPLYEGDRTLEDVLRLLDNGGFDPGDEDPHAIYPQTAVPFERNDAKAEKIRFEALLSRSNAERELQAALVKQRDTEIDRLKRDHDRVAALAQERKADLDNARQLAAEQQALLADRDQQLQKLEQDRDEQAALAAELEKSSQLAQEYKARLEEAGKRAAEQQALVADRDQQLQKLEQGRDAQAALAAELEKSNQLVQECKARLEEAGKRAAEQQALVADRDQQLRKLEQDRDAQAALVAEREAELEKSLLVASGQQKLVSDKDDEISGLTRDRDRIATQLADSQAGHAALEKRIGTLEEELLGSRQTASLSVRLQTLREEDLKDLQVRYRALMEKNESQHRLLVKLSERLTVASEYFHQLKLANEAAESGGQVGRVIEVVKSPKPRTRKASRKQKKDK